jgi:hypothetical protein
MAKKMKRIGPGTTRPFAPARVSKGTKNYLRRTRKSLTPKVVSRHDSYSGRWHETVSPSLPKGLFHKGSTTRKRLATELRKTRKKKGRSGMKKLREYVSPKWTKTAAMSPDEYRRKFKRRG